MLGLALGLAFLTGFGLGAAAVVVWAGLGMLALARNSLSLVAALAIALVAGLGAWHARENTIHEVPIPPPGAFEGVLRIDDGPFLTQNGQRFLVHSEKMPEARLCAYAPAEPQAFSGDRVFVSGRVTLLQDLSAIGLAATRARGCDAQLRIASMQIVDAGSGVRSLLSRSRMRLSEFLMRAAPGDVGALMSGLVTGEDGALSEDASGAFLSSGTTHITAISGANFAMIAMLLGVLATGAMRRNVGFVLAASAVIWLYALMVGLQPSAFRAALLATAVLIGKWIGRRPDLLTLTVLLAALQVAVRPHDFGTLAFQLSLAATIALVVVFDGSERIPDRPWLATLGLSVFAAQLATIPILAWQLGTVSGISLFANLIVGPAAGLAFPIALVGAFVGQVAPILGEVVLLPAIVISRAMLAFVEWSDRHLPGSVALGEPTTAAIGILALGCWVGIFWLSGDLRRTARHGLLVARSW